MNQSMQKIFLRRFIWYVVVPVILLLGIGVPFMINTIESDEIKNQEIMLNNFQESLEREISEGSFKLAQFLLVNNQQMMDLMVDYYSEDTELEYDDYQTMDENFSFLTFVNLRIEGIEFYYNNGHTYSRKTYSLLSHEEVQQRKWYKVAKETPNQIEVGMGLASDFIASVSSNAKNTKQELIFALSPDNYDHNDELDIIFMLQECTTFESLQELEGSSYSAYILDDEEKILLQSDDKYTSLIEMQGLKGFEGSKVALSADINLTDWKLLLIRDESQSLIDYLQGLLILLALMLIIFSVYSIFVKDFLYKIAAPVSGLAKEMNSLNLSTNKVQVQEDVPYEIGQIQEQFNVMLDRIQNLVAENKEKEEARYNEELKALQLQINPHFLSNTLNTIKFMAQVAKFDSIRDMTGSLMQIMDCSFRNHDSLHTLAEEKSVLESYSYIMNIRYAESYRIMIELHEDCKDYLIPKLTLQPFVENALVHGLQEYTDEGVVEVKIHNVQHDDKKMMKIMIRDNGQGMSLEMISNIYRGQEPKEGRIGITNVIRRLKLYYGESFEFKIDSMIGRGTTFELYIPIQEEEACIQ